MATKPMQIKGLDNHVKRLRRLAGEGADRALGIAVQEATALGVEAIVNKVDQLGLVDTGTYKRGFVTRESGNPQVGIIATNVAYALMIEYGINGDVTIKAHPRKSKKGTIYTVKSHTRRMVRPAYLVVTSQLPVIRRLFAAALRRQINKVAKEA